jgi:hypothetical protein
VAHQQATPSSIEPKAAPVPAYSTGAARWSGQNVYVRVPDTRWRLTSVWLDAADVTRR